MHKPDEVKKVACDLRSSGRRSSSCWDEIADRISQIVTVYQTGENIKKSRWGEYKCLRFFSSSSLIDTLKEWRILKPLKWNGIWLVCKSEWRWAFHDLFTRFLLSLSVRLFKPSFKTILYLRYMRIFLYIGSYDSRSQYKDHKIGENSPTSHVLPLSA